MHVNVLGINLYFEVEGKGKEIILLHGWGANMNTFNDLSNHLKDSFKVYKLDLPGFGKSIIEEEINISKNAEIIKAFCNVLNIDNPIIIAHSYGGRIAIKYASKYKCYKLILVSSAGIKQKLKLSKKIKIKTYKFLKKCKININLGSSDYKNAKGVLRKMLVMAVNEDLSEELTKINIPVLLVWGENDKQTPVVDAKKMNLLLKNSGLVVIENCGHFCYLERSSYFKIVLDSFLNSDKLDE